MNAGQRLYPSDARLEIGIISDTHGLLRPEAMEYLNGCHAIFHGGDIGKEAVLEKLKRIAPVFAVRGNVDRDPWAQSLPIREVIEIGSLCFYMVHDIADLDLDPANGFDAVIYGHSHIPKSYWKKGVLYFNPGAAGPKRFSLPIAMGKICILKDRIESFTIKFL